MSGIRLSHPTARSGMFTFEHRKRPYPVPLLCPMCAKAHAVKTYHINVDAEGFAIVSREVWDLMRKHNTAGFQIANEVAQPPPLIIGAGAGSAPPTALEEVTRG